MHQLIPPPAVPEHAGHVTDAAALLEDGEVSLSDPRILRAALAGRHGVPLAGREQESRELQAAGYRDLPFGRLYEGHVNVLQLIARLGTDKQRAWVAAAAGRGELFGLWNTEAHDGVRIVRSGPCGLILQGRKTFCSGAPAVAHALISARTPDGAMQLVLVDMNRERPAQDPSFWKPLGMERSESFAVDFTGVHVQTEAILGPPGAYAATPWFEAGAWRFLAVQAGGVRRLFDDYLAWLHTAGRESDILTQANIGKCYIAVRTCGAWLSECAKAWREFDRCRAEVSGLLLTVDAARVAVECAALDVAERIERGVGARGLLEPAPFSQGLRDLRMYLRQPAPDQAMLRVGSAALASRSTRSARDGE